MWFTETRHTMWCTPTNGFAVAAARVFAAFEHTLKQPAMPGRALLVPSRKPVPTDYVPGPLVYAIPSMSPNVISAS